MKKTAILTLTLTLLTTVGCATIISDKNYQIAFNSHPEGAHVVIKDENDKTIHAGTTPFSVTLESGDGYFDGMDYTAHFELEGYEAQDREVASSLDEWYWGNIIFGGLVGLLIVDPATGAMWEFDDSVTVVLNQARPPAIAMAE